jgi:hypothetical protein
VVINDTWRRTSSLRYAFVTIDPQDASKQVWTLNQKNLSGEVTSAMAKMTLSKTPSSSKLSDTLSGVDAGETKSRRGTGKKG